MDLHEDLENYFANTIIPQLYVDANMKLRKFTPPAMNHFSLTEQYINKDIHTVKDNIRYPTFIDNINEVMISGKLLEKEVQTTDGRWYQMNILPYVVHKTGQTNGVIITFVDISKRIATLKELEKLNAKHEILVDTLTHDLRQPLAAIIMLSDVLLKSFEKQDSEKFSKLIKRLRETSKDMESLLKGFLEESTTEISTEAERVNIENICEDVVLSLRDEIHSNGITIKTEFNTSEINFSRNNLRSILFNLLNNAIKFKRTEEPLEIFIKTEKLDDSVELSIQDNGMGIANKNLEKIFEKGIRLNTQIEGTGMGLYIMKRMLANKGGKIEVESTLGKGSVVKVYFKRGYFGEKKTGTATDN